MMRNSCLFFLSIFSLTAAAQIDTLQQLTGIEVHAYFGTKDLMHSPASASIIDNRQLQLQPSYSMVSALNTVPGVRMEERSPGSYRLSVRGSLLRSPFGIRNIKIYLDDFPLTDAGGNSYLNGIDAGNINRIEILKGPDASVFGANSGGVILISPVPAKADSSYAMAGMSGGSFGLLHQKLALQETFHKYRINLAQAFQRSDGYRDNSSLKRHYVQLFQQLNYVPSAQLKVLLLYSDLSYRTPGGLTLLQYQINPRAARPATATLPGAEEQQAGITNKTIYGGLSHQLFFTRNFRHVLTVFGSHTDFANPFISNYETRSENSFGTRTYLELATDNGLPFTLKWQTGIEAQQTQSLITNYGNRSGARDSLQSRDHVNALSHFYFTRLALSLLKKLTAEAALSINYYGYAFRNQFPAYASRYSNVTFAPQLMPRLTVAYTTGDHTAWRASVSRGYSAPTIAEIRSSNQAINTSLQPETGWNYETGIRAYSARQSWFIDACIFYFRLDEAIVRRLDAAGNEYFVNAGGTNQAGLELQANTTLIKPKSSGLIRNLSLQNSFTHHRFFFRSYSDASTNYSGKQLTGTPQFVNVCGIQAGLPHGFSAFIQYNYTGPIPLNDANAVYAREYHLLQAKAMYRKRFRTFGLELFAGADNLLDQSYSLGNDLNAFGGRYYNPAPKRSYYLGFTVML